MSVGIHNIGKALLVACGLGWLCLVSAYAQPADPPRAFVVVPNENSEDVDLYKDGSYALLVGVSDYTNGWSDLRAIPGELEEAKAALELHGFEVTLELEKTTSSEIDDVFKDFIRKYGNKRDNRLVFIFSGHGHTWKDGEQGYLVPSDAPRPVEDDEGYPGEEFAGKALHMDQIVSWAKQMRARHALFLFDSCFSGTVFNTRSDDSAPPAKRFVYGDAVHKVRQYITAGSADETVPARSTFMPAFVDAITRGKGDLYPDGVITGSELGLYLSNVVKQHTGRSPQYGTQPNNYALSRGDMVFMLPASLRTPAEEPDPAVSDTVKGDGFQRPDISDYRLIQDYLKTKGYYSGLVDGIWGTESHRAFQALIKDSQMSAAVLIEAIKKSVAGSSADSEVQVASQISAEPKPGDRFQDCDDCPEMVVIPAGEFTMGSPESEKGRDDNEGPQHKVTIGAPFALGRYEITVGQFEAFVADTDYKTEAERSDSCWIYDFEKKEFVQKIDRHWQSPGFVQDKEHPVVCVSHNDAEAYVEWLSKTTGVRYRLPSEAEWEYAARAGTDTATYRGNSPDDACAYANGADEALKKTIPEYPWPIHACLDRYDYTAPVADAGFKANPFGLSHMLGNVWEWTADCWHEDYDGAPLDGSVWLDTDSGDCDRRVLRGGGWGDIPESLRAAFRFWYIRDDAFNIVGFRLARTL